MPNEFILPLATISIFLYFLLAFVSTYWLFIITQRKRRTKEYHATFDESKILFFGIMAISACFEIPQFCGCLIYNGPIDCEWNDDLFYSFYFLHRLALIGFVFCLQIAAILWSDIVLRHDGKFWWSSSPLSRIKIFFRVTFVIYFIIQVTCGLLIFFIRPGRGREFNEDSIGRISNYSSSILAFIISLGCLYCGFKLERYVLNLKLPQPDTRTIMWSLNSLMLVVALSYFVKAGLVFYLGSDSRPIPFGLWLAFTRWLPYVFCSLWLVRVMSKSDTRSSTISVYQIDGFAVPVESAGLLQGEGEEGTGTHIRSIHDPSLSLSMRHEELDHSPDERLSFSYNLRKVFGQSVFFGGGASFSERKDTFMDPQSNSFLDPTSLSHVASNHIDPIQRVKSPSDHPQQIQSINHPKHLSISP